MDRYLQLFHNRPVAAALYKKVSIFTVSVVQQSSGIYVWYNSNSNNSAIASAV